MIFDLHTSSINFAQGALVAVSILLNHKSWARVLFFSIQKFFEFQQLLWAAWRLVGWIIRTPVWGERVCVIILASVWLQFYTFCPNEVSRCTRSIMYAVVEAIWNTQRRAKVESSQLALSGDGASYKSLNGWYEVAKIFVTYKVDRGLLLTTVYALVASYSTHSL